MHIRLPTEGNQGIRWDFKMGLLIPITNFDCSIPSYFSSSFGFFSHLIELCEMCSFSKHLGVRWLQPMQCSLCMRPLKLPLFLPKVLLCCESNLHGHEINQKQLTTETPLNKVLQQTGAIHTLCSITRSQALPLRA